MNYSVAKPKGLYHKLDFYFTTQTNSVDINQKMTLNIKMD